MIIHPVESGPVATIGYYVIGEESGKGIVIDVPLDSTGFYTSMAEKTKTEITAILLTHSHWDHTADAPKLRRLTKSPIYIHKSDEYRIIAPMTHTVWQLPFNLEAANADKYLENGEILDFGDISLQVLHTPGHTEGGVCFVSNNDKTVFAGDTIFRESIGRVDLPGGSMSQLIESIETKLMTMPDEFKIFCGHGPTSTIGWERLNNPFINGIMT